MESSEEKRGSDHQSGEAVAGRDASRSGSQDSASIARASELIKTIKTSNRARPSKAGTSEIVDEIAQEEQEILDDADAQDNGPTIVLAEILKLKQADDEEHLFLARWAGQTEEEATWETLQVFAGTQLTSKGYTVEPTDENGSNVIEVLKAYVNNLSMQEKDNSGEDANNSSQKAGTKNEAQKNGAANPEGHTDSGNQSGGDGAQDASKQLGKRRSGSKEVKRNSKKRKAAPRGRPAKNNNVKAEPQEEAAVEGENPLKDAAADEQQADDKPTKPAKRSRAAKQASKKVQDPEAQPEAADQPKGDRTEIEDEQDSKSGTSGSESGTASDTLSESASETLSESEADDTYGEEDGTSLSGTDDSAESESEESGSSEDYTEGYSDEATDFTEDESDSEEDYLRQSRRLRRRRLLNKLRYRKYDESETTYEATSSTEDDSLNWRARSRNRSKDRYGSHKYYEKIVRGKIRPFKKRYEDLEVSFGVEGKINKHDVKRIVSLVVVNGTMFFEVSWHRDRKGNKPRKSLIQDKLFAKEYPDMVIDFLNKGRMLGSYY